jgi:hypothetical protein
MCLWFLDVLTYLYLYILSSTTTCCLGESGPGCSAHAESCDGSTGIATNQKKNLFAKKKNKQWFFV